MKKIKQIEIMIALIFGLSYCCFLSSCNQKILPEIINPDQEGLNTEVREFLLSGTPGVLVLGTGLCENCKIVKNIVIRMKEQRKDLKLSWLVYENYQDRKTFQAFNLTISPTTYLISTNHQILKRIIGTFTEQELLDNLKEEGLIH